MKEYLSVKNFSIFRIALPVFLFITTACSALFHLIYMNEVDHLTLAVQILFSVTAPLIVFIFLLNKSEVYLENNKLYVKNFSNIIEISKENVQKVNSLFSFTSSKIIVLS